MGNCEKEKYFDFVKTNDGSTGLFNHDVNDIYHSSYGAKNEAIEKFITPLNFEQNFFSKKEIKILDICFGIGYNTKALLEKVIQTNYSGKISIDILEYDKNLALLSPFIIDGFFESTFETSFILSSKLFEQIYEHRDWINQVLEDEDNKNFIEPFYRDLVKKYLNDECSYDPQDENNPFLHNIYYQCISRRNKSDLKPLMLDNFLMAAYFDDARKTIKRLIEPYDIIFLDAFTPTKLPTLWSVEFFKEIYRLSKQDSILVTYSNSSAIRNAMLEAGFIVGKSFDENNKACGTCASKNPELIKNKLNDYDLGLLKTNAGVCFQDEGLCKTPDDILSEWKKRKMELRLEASGHYIKRYKKEHLIC